VHKYTFKLIFPPLQDAFIHQVFMVEIVPLRKLPVKHRGTSREHCKTGDKRTPETMVMLKVRVFVVSFWWSKVYLKECYELVFWGTT